MNWVFEHLQIIIVVAGAIAYWINQRAREKAGQEADYDEDGVPERRAAPRAETRELSPVNRDGADIDQEERARRIREEIQRKIAERRGRAPGSAPAAPPPVPRFDPFRPVFQEEVRPTPLPLRPAEPPTPREPVSAYDDSAALERQRRLAEQMEELEEKRLEARRVAAQARSGDAPSSGESSTAGRGGLGTRGVAAELRDPRALRRAIVLREVLSAPVALR